ncbi:FkbM family methyltransferase [Alienimonas sp. DA493]|uniref:FkbM family methyltransferase n=1 Tax=Alienimonas sp. DA493 TaxID=3373605 RepID=UPI0037540FA0
MRRVLAGPLHGVQFVVRDAMGVAYALGMDGQHLRGLAGRVRAGQTVYDVGGNRGQVALLFAGAVGSDGRVVCFEPVPSLADDLERNLALNEFGQARVVRAAAADAEGVMTFDFPEDRATQGKLRDVEPTYRHDGASVLQVNAVTLDGVVAAGERSPDLLKIDVEGAAAAVLRGARRLLEERAPAVYIELHGPEERAGVRDELLSRGYRAETMDGRPVTDPLADRADPLWCEHIDPPGERR